MSMNQPLEISLLGELRVDSMGTRVALPASRKTRALLAFLVGTGRPHRRERLCELFWNLPDDPKAALRWSLSKLRKVVDAPGHTRIVADRERVHFDATDVLIDIKDLHVDLLQRTDVLPIDALEKMADRLERVLLDGLDGAGVGRFDAWLVATPACHRSPSRNGSAGGAKPTRAVRRTIDSGYRRPSCRDSAPWTIHRSHGTTRIDRPIGRLNRTPLQARGHRDSWPLRRRCSATRNKRFVRNGSGSARPGTERRSPTRRWAPVPRC